MVEAFLGAAPDYIKNYLNKAWFINNSDRTLTLTNIDTEESITVDIGQSIFISEASWRASTTYTSSESVTIIATDSNNSIIKLYEVVSGGARVVAPFTVSKNITYIATVQ